MKSYVMLKTKEFLTVPKQQFTHVVHKLFEALPLESAL